MNDCNDTQKSIQIAAQISKRLSLSEDALRRPVYTGPALIDAIFDLIEAHGDNLLSEGQGTLSELISEWVLGYAEGCGLGAPTERARQRAGRFYDKLCSDRQVDFDDPDLCNTCGGRCCKIYRRAAKGGTMPDCQDYDQWLSRFHHDRDIYGVDPLFAPVTSEIESEETTKQREEIRAKGFDPERCEYCGANGCIIPRHKRPLQCRTFRCSAWVTKEAAFNPTQKNLP